MSQSNSVTVLCALVVSAALVLAPELLLAQRGAHGGGGGGGFHGGGGGFHGGGGGFHGGGGGGYRGGSLGGYRGGASYGGYRGGTSYSGYRGGAAAYGYRNGGSNGVYRGSGHYYAGGAHYGYRNGVSRGGSYGGGYYGGHSAYYGNGYYGGHGYYGNGYYGHGYYGHGYYGGGYWGYPFYGYGFGISIGFNFGPFWGGYYYPYVYAPQWVAPPCYYYAYPCYVSGYAPAYTSPYVVTNNSVPDDDPAEYANAAIGPSSQQLAEAAVRQLPSARPQVRNAILALSGMPPAARERQIEILYAGFSPEERLIVKNAVFTPAPAQNSVPVMRTAVRPEPQQRPEMQNAIRTLQAMPPAARERQINSGMYSNFSPEERAELLKTVSQVQPVRVAQPGM